ncbi:MAG: IS4 family transposase [Dehalobacterium sp.]
MKNLGKDFTRNRKLDFASVIKLIMSMGGNSIKKELHEFFYYNEDTISSSAFYQQRNKIQTYAFEFLLNEFTNCFDKPKVRKGYRLLAVDGSDLNIYHNPQDPETYIRHGSNNKGYNSLHLNGFYDLLNKIYLDAIVQPSKHLNEYRALVDIVDRSNVSGEVIVIADRGYESYNVLAHIAQKGWNYVIRVKGITSNGIAGALNLPDSDEFDIKVALNLTRKQTKAFKALPALYRYLPKEVPFDYLDAEQLLFAMNFRVVRFKISENTYETILTNLEEFSFPFVEIKELYNLRWGIETSFRELKYAIGLTSFHSKKVAYITQEIFARLVMYNFCEMIIMHIIIKKKNTKHDYQANFTVAIDICKKFFRNPENKHPPNVEALIQKNILPIRNQRKYPRNVRRGRTVSFTYRVA